MADRHTPGPWRWDLNNDQGSPLIYGFNYEPVVAMHHADYNSEAWWEVRDADARLIAAAPELLAALKGLRALIRAEFPSAYECVDGERADTAIAKAEDK